MHCSKTLQCTRGRLSYFLRGQGPSRAHHELRCAEKLVVPPLAYLVCVLSLAAHASPTKISPIRIT